MDPKPWKPSEDFHIEIKNDEDQAKPTSQNLPEQPSEVFYARRIAELRLNSRSVPGHPRQSRKPTPNTSHRSLKTMRMKNSYKKLPLMQNMHVDTCSERAKPRRVETFWRHSESRKSDLLQAKTLRLLSGDMSLSCRFRLWQSCSPLLVFSGLFQAWPTAIGFHRNSPLMSFHMAECCETPQ